MSEPTTSPSVLNAPKNGATSQTQPSSEPKPATAAPADPIDREVQLKAREEALDKRERVWKAETKKWATQKDGLGAKLSEYEQLKKEVPELRKYKSESEQRSQLRKLNPIAALEEDFGKDWREKITALSVNGVPPTDLIASLMQQMKAEFKAELDARDAKTEQQTTANEQQDIEQTRAMVASDAAQWYEANAKEYPVFERLGDPRRIGQILGQRIESEFMRSKKVISAEAAAKGLEEEMLGIVEAAVKADKYKAKLQPETKPANVSSSSGSTQGVSSSTRRTLDNSMTASTSGRAPPRSDAEREARATEAFNAVRAKGKA